jgi:hypothetical protein
MLSPEETGQADTAAVLFNLKTGTSLLPSLEETSRAVDSASALFNLEIVTFPLLIREVKS